MITEKLRHTRDPNLAKGILPFLKSAKAFKPVNNIL